MKSVGLDGIRFSVDDSADAFYVLIRSQMLAGYLGDNWLNYHLLIDTAVETGALERISTL